MNMKKTADEAINSINERMEAHVSSLCATDDEIRMRAMACRIQELEGKLQFLVENDSINDFSIEKEVVGLLNFKGSDEGSAEASLSVENIRRQADKVSKLLDTNPIKT